MNNSFWKEVIAKGRIAQWLIAGGGVTLCIVGGLMGFLDAQTIGVIFLAIVAAAFGIESIAK